MGKGRLTLKKFKSRKHASRDVQGVHVGKRILDNLPLTQNDKTRLLAGVTCSFPISEQDGGLSHFSLKYNMWKFSFCTSELVISEDRVMMQFISVTKHRDI